LTEDENTGTTGVCAVEVTLPGTEELLTESVVAGTALLDAVVILPVTEEVLRVDSFPGTTIILDMVLLAVVFVVLDLGNPGVVLVVEVML